MLSVRQMFRIKKALFGCHEHKKLNAIILKHTAQFPHQPCLALESLSGFLGIGEPAIHLSAIIVVHVLLVIQPVMLACRDVVGVCLSIEVPKVLVVEPDDGFPEAETFAKLLLHLLLVVTRAKPLDV